MQTSDSEMLDWRLASQIEKGRNEVLRMVAQNESLESILNTLCRKSQIYNAEMLCSVLRLDNQKKTLHPIASVALPEFYCEAIDGVEIGSGVGSCGTAAFSKKRVIVEDINTHPYWNQYKDLALQADLQACWSEPIIGPNGWVYGTFAMYYRTPKSPTEEDLNFIEVSANLAAVVFENHDNREKLLTANALLSNTIDKRNKKLKKVNEALTKALEEQNHLHHAEMKNEKMITANNLIAGFSHEISTPVGIALTAITTSEDKLSTLVEQFLTNTLPRTTFANKLRELEDIIGISKRSLLKTNDLMLRFKEASTSSCTDIKYAFSIRDFFDEFNTIAQNMLGDHQLSIHCEDIEIVSNKASLWQIFFNLVENLLKCCCFRCTREWDRIANIANTCSISN